MDQWSRDPGDPGGGPLDGGVRFDHRMDNGLCQDGNLHPGTLHQRHSDFRAFHQGNGDGAATRHKESDHDHESDESPCNGKHAGEFVPMDMNVLEDPPAGWRGEPREGSLDRHMNREDQ